MDDPVGGPAVMAPSAVAPGGPELLDQILPPEVACAETFHDEPGAVLFPQEQAIVSRAASKRRTEFAAGRACARAALARLGEPPAPILPGLRGAPRWPDGVTGSITHCAGYRAAAVARTRDVLALGLDAEPNQRLPDGVLEMIAVGKERAQVAQLTAAQPGVSWDRLLFSAKESVYKTWFPLARRRLDFDAAHIVIDAAGGTLTARVLVPGPVVAGSPLTSLRGRWLAARELLVTAIVVPA